MELPCDGCDQSPSIQSPVFFLCPEKGPYSVARWNPDILGQGCVGQFAGWRCGKSVLLTPMDAVTRYRREKISALFKVFPSDVPVRCAQCIEKQAPNSNINLKRPAEYLIGLVSDLRKRAEYLSLEEIAACLSRRDSEVLSKHESAAYAEFEQELLRRHSNRVVVHVIQGVPQVIAKERLHGRRHPPRTKLRLYAKQLDWALRRYFALRKTAVSKRQRSRLMIPLLLRTNPFLSVAPWPMGVPPDPFKTSLDDPKLLDRVRKLLRD